MNMFHQNTHVYIIPYIILLLEVRDSPSGADYSSMYCIFTYVVFVFPYIVLQGALELIPMVLLPSCTLEPPFELLGVPCCLVQGGSHLISGNQGSEQGFGAICFAIRSQKGTRVENRDPSQRRNFT